MSIFEAAMSSAQAHSIAFPVWGKKHLEQIFNMATRVVTEQYRGSDDMDTSTVHIPVLRDEVIERLELARGGNFLDCTLGGGGHSLAILDAAPDARVVATDRDVR